ncbi:MAG: ABC transporter permease subunit [Anaerolineae bacterium]|nr:ABC transporter permease subunit [Anaerolineae bacterium]
MNGLQSIALTGRHGNASRILRYVLIRAVTLLVTVVVAVYLTILIANFGGQIDAFVRADIDFAVGLSMKDVRGLTTEERAEMAEARRQAAYEAAGLNTPFAVRCLRWLRRGLTLDWGDTNLSFAGRWTGQTGEIRAIILDALSRSLLIFGSANLLLFLTTVLVALPMTNTQRSWLDKLVIALSPLSAAPAWVYGVLLNLIALSALGNVFAGSAFDAWPDTFKLAYVPMIMRHLVLPLLAIFLSGLFQGIYTWRMYFQLHAAEDYVELARAKGLPSGMLERRYILRPMLPTLLTSFALIFVNLWQEVIILEQVFNIQGIGSAFFGVVTYNVPERTPFIVALVVTFAYLLAVTVFMLDIVYVIVDPRIKIGGEGQTVEAARTQRAGRRGQPLSGILDRIRAGLQVAPHRGAGLQDALAASQTSEGPEAARGQRHPEGLERRSWRRRLDPTLESARIALRQLAGYPAAVVGLVIILVLIATSIYAVIAIPYDEMLFLWRDGQDAWMDNPKDALPTWVNLFRKDKLPQTLIMDSRATGDMREVPDRTVEVVSEDMTEITLQFSIDYAYGGLPQDLAVFVDARYDEKRPLTILTWLTPDGREIELTSTSMTGASLFYRVSQDENLARKLGTEHTLEALLVDPAAADRAVRQGAYELRVTSYVFEDDADVDAKMVLYGQVFGLAGTDERRRDLAVPLLWGMAVALAFGLLAAVITTLSSVLIAAVSTWLGGWADVLIQRITEVNMILPFLPVSVMVYVLYSKSFWTILGVTIVLSIFGTSIKTYRALLLQVRESPYIEAAQAYGAGNGRIIFRYLIPRIVSVLVPHVIILVPSYVFLEASLAFLGVSDPVLPTWGKLIAQGLSRNIYTETYHLILEPLGLLLVLSFAFVMLGISLERHTRTRLGIR